MAGLWGEEYEVPSREKTKELLNKIKSPKSKEEDICKQLGSKSLTLRERLSLITENVMRILGRQKDHTIVLRTRQQLHDYISKAIENDVIALDTETSNTLDYLNCKLIGPCIYTPGQKQAYVPINHVDPDTNERLSWQMTEKDVREELQRLIDAKTKIVYHNYKFDFQVLKATCNIEMPAYWDTWIGIKMIDENEKASLKKLYVKFIDPTQEKYDIEHLFDAKFVKYAQVDPEIFALYAATDSMMTYKLYLYEKEIFETDQYKGMYKLFLNIEMPLIKVVANMEYRGIGIDEEYSKRLSEKYHQKQAEINKKVMDELEKYRPQIEAWKLTPEAQVKDGKKTKLEMLEDPINVNSPKQLAIFLFDILKFPEGLGKTVDDKPRSTGANVLEILAKDYNFHLGTLLAEKGGMDTLVSTFVDAIPTKLNSYDNKIHTLFNQLGAIARFSCGGKERGGQKLINLQNIPAQDVKDIRPMFQVDPGYVLVGADLSGAELRAAVNSCRDEELVRCYNEGRDLYSLIGSVAYNCSYEDACEFYPEGKEIDFQGQKVITGHKTHTNYTGKKHRNAAKKIGIGLVYGRGPASIAEQIGEPLEKGKEILDKVNKGFPGLKVWMDQVRDNTLKLGYVDDCLGRRRHLPNALLPKYSFESINKDNINPFLNCENNYIDPKIKDKYVKLLETANFKEVQKLTKEAATEGVRIINNQAKIAEALREAPNWCCQAQTASWIKMNMIAIDNDPLLKKLGAELLLTIHDEVQLQCPRENAEEVKTRLEYLMSNTCKDLVCIPLPSDGTIEWSGKWYMSEMETLINAHFNEYTHGDEENGILPLSKEEAYQRICKEEPELIPENIHNFLFNGEYLR